ncbi:MAG: hypothetical protein ACRD3C_01825 [Vicinamibacterales bacterium]
MLGLLSERWICRLTLLSLACLLASTGPLAAQGTSGAIADITITIGLELRRDITMALQGVQE